ncbi:MAG: hypothetical protein ACKVU2_04105 [Saprospiraceae bacterium]
MKRTTHSVQKTPAKLLLAIAILLNAVHLSAQDLQIYYDLFTDSMTYKKGGVEVFDPKIRKGDFVVLHFTEFNPYLYRAEVDVEQSNADGWSGGASSGALGATTGIAGMLAPFLGGSLGTPGGGSGSPMSFMDLPLLSLGQGSLKLSDLFGGSSRGSEKQLLEDAQKQLQTLTQTQSRMAELYQAIQKMEQSERVAKVAVKYLDQLLLNPRIRPSMIQKIVAEYQALVFPEKSADALRLLDAIEWEKRPQVKSRLLQELQAKQIEFDLQMANLEPKADELSNVANQNKEIEQFVASLRNITGQGGPLRQQMEAYIAEQNKNAAKPMSFEEILELQMRFRELAEQQFTYPVAISVEKGTIIVTGRLVPLDSIASAGKDKKVGPKTKTVKLETRGGLRISTGFGVAFGRMLEPSEEFSVRDGAIVADEGGVVQPSLATFIHFSAMNSRKGIGLAGTFGIGIPLSASSITSLNFYLGPSLLFGRGQRIVLTGGIMAASAKRLAKGFNIGDPFDPEQGDIPTRTRYELGYFVGISFSLGG